MALRESLPSGVVASAAAVGAALGAYCCWRSQQCRCDTVVIFGVGYTGERVALRLRQAGYRVVGTARTAASAARLASQLEIEMVVFDGTTDGAAGLKAAEVVASATHILATAQPGEAGDPMLCNPTLKAAIVSRLASGELCWLGYLSTVGVYGNTDGAPVTEDTPVNPRSTRGKRRVVAEDQWRGLGGPLHIFRLPGIYGPGRGPLEKVRGGTARCLVKPGHKFSRIHVDDIATVLLASVHSPSCLKPLATAEVFNVTDDEPAASHDVTEHAAKLLGVAPPPRQDFETAELSATVRSFYAESRLLSNDKIKRDLGISLLYPTYREGQAAQLREERRLGMAPELAPSTKVAIAASSTNRPQSTTNGKATRRVVFLVDNGSVRAAATLSLRSLAAGLQDFLGDGTTVVAVSARWSDRVDPEELGGKRAELLLPTLRQHVATVLADAQAQEGVVSIRSHIVVCPLFIGPSDSVAEFMPNQLRAVAQEHQSAMELFRLELAPPLVCLCPFIEKTLPMSRRGESRIAEILHDRVREALALATPEELGDGKPVVVVVDHGTPSAAVNRVRNHVTDQLRAQLAEKDEATAVLACSMERRDGVEYDFNEPMLEDIFAHPDVQATNAAKTPIVLAMLFLQPGKHAGEGGDIDQLVEAAQKRYAMQTNEANGSSADSAEVQRRTVLKTGLLAPHPKLTALLRDRIAQAFPVTMMG